MREEYEGLYIEEAETLVLAGPGVGIVPTRVFGRLRFEGAGKPVKVLVVADESKEEVEDLKSMKSYYKERVNELEEKVVEKGKELYRKKMMLSRIQDQVQEALAILEGGTDYERLHLAGILQAGLEE